ncbi:hypothetical protein ACE3MZ_06190 [Paenibacillus sp. WLX1005]|uniref:hypothetical protein n=1 Tax=Paenibacillus sp. WLX1005 TaxID=3243766 RepID=UPI0039845520
MRKIIQQGLLAGLVSGIILGLVLKWIQYGTGALVYTLLLNVDFVPVLPDVLPEWLEFAMHLVVALVLGVLFRLWISRWHHPWLAGLTLGAASSLLFFPLAMMSDRVPAVNDGQAYMYWLIGHLVYGLVLGMVGRWQIRQRSLF